MVLPDKTGWYKVTGFGEEYILYIVVQQYDLYAVRTFISPMYKTIEISTYTYHRYRHQEGHSWEDREHNSHIFPRDFEFITDKR
jgi:hypothetical protein